MGLVISIILVTQCTFAEYCDCKYPEPGKLVNNIHLCCTYIRTTNNEMDCNGWFKEEDVTESHNYCNEWPPPPPPPNFQCKCKPSKPAASISRESCCKYINLGHRDECEGWIDVNNPSGPDNDDCSRYIVGLRKRPGKLPLPPPLKLHPYGDYVQVWRDVGVKRLIDHHGNVILYQREGSPFWKIPIDYFTKLRGWEHDPDSGSEYNWQEWNIMVDLEGQEVKSTTRGRQKKIVWSEENHYFMGFEDRDYKQPLHIDESSPVNMGYPEDMFIFWPNKYQPLYVMDRSSAANSRNIIVWKRDRFDDTFTGLQWDRSHIPASDGWQYEHIEGKQWRRVCLDGVHKLSSHKPKAAVQQSMILHMEQIDPFEPWHLWREVGEIEEMQPKTIEHIKSFHHFPYKSVQGSCGDCTIHSVNTVLGAEYWTNKQYTEEFVLPYFSKMKPEEHGRPQKLWFGRKGELYEGFSTDSSYRALYKAGAQQKKIPYHKLDELKSMKFDHKTIGLRFAYYPDGDPEIRHIVAYKYNIDKRGYGHWWFIQSWKKHDPLELKGIDDVIVHMRSLWWLDPTKRPESPKSPGTVFLVTLLPDRDRLVSPEEIDRNILLDIELNRDGTSVRPRYHIPAGITRIASKTLSTSRSHLDARQSKDNTYGKVMYYNILDEKEKEERGLEQLIEKEKKALSTLDRIKNQMEGNRVHKRKHHRYYS